MISEPSLSKITLITSSHQSGADELKNRHLGGKKDKFGIVVFFKILGQSALQLYGFDLEKLSF